VSPFKDIFKKAKDLVESAAQKARFDDVVAHVAAEILAEHGYRVVDFEEPEITKTVAKLEPPESERLLEIARRDLKRRHGSKALDRLEKISLEYVIVEVEYEGSVLLDKVAGGKGKPDTEVEVELVYKATLKGFLGLMKDTKKEKARVTEFKIASSDFIDEESREVDRGKLRAELERWFKMAGLIG